MISPLVRYFSIVPSMKLKLLLLTLVMCNLQAMAQDWYFAGVRVKTDTGTVNKHATKYGYDWIRMDNDKTATKAAFKKAAKQSYKSVDIIYKSSKSYKFIAIYKISVMESQWKGNKKKKVTYYKFYANKSEDAIKKSIVADTKLHHYIGIERVELIDLQKKKAELNQQTKNPAPGRAVQ